MFPFLSLKCILSLDVLSLGQICCTACYLSDLHLSSPLSLFHRYTLAFWPTFKYVVFHLRLSRLYQTPESSLWERPDDCLRTQTPSDGLRFISSYFPWWSGLLPNWLCNYTVHIKAVGKLLMGFDA